MKETSITGRAIKASGFVDLKDYMSKESDMIKCHAEKSFAVFGLMTILAALFTWGAYQYSQEFAHEFWLVFGNLAILVFGSYFAILCIVMAGVTAIRALSALGIRMCGFSEIDIERMALHL